jgi:hypothetical protein
VDMIRSPKKFNPNSSFQSADDRTSAWQSGAGAAMFRVGG